MNIPTIFGFTGFQVGSPSRPVPRVSGTLTRSILDPIRKHTHARFLKNKAADQARIQEGRVRVALSFEEASERASQALDATEGHMRSTGEPLRSDWDRPLGLGPTAHRRHRSISFDGEPLYNTVGVC